MKTGRFGSRYQNIKLAWLDGPQEGFDAFDTDRGENVLINSPHRWRGRLEAFDAHADAFAKLDHRCIMPLLDRGVCWLGSPFYTLPASARGGTKLVWTLERDPDALTMRDLASIIGDAAETLHHVHQSGFLHLQLTPYCLHLPNRKDLMLANGWLFWPPVQMEFGGHPFFCAPEQLGRSAEPIDARADVYALGAVLFSFIHARPDDEQRRVTVREYLEKRAPSLTLAAQRDRVLASRLEAVAMQALETDPTNRPPTAAAFAREVRQLLWR